MVETKIIILDQQEIVYKIHYKRIKNCYLRVENNMVFNFSCVYFSACRYSGKRSYAFATETVVHRPPIKRVMKNFVFVCFL